MYRVGAGPVGLTAAAELRRQGVRCRIIDRLPDRLPYAKAVDVQPRTLEVWDRMGMVRAALEAAVPLRGQLVYADGLEQARLELRLPPEVPYAFAALPQYETERIIEEQARFGTGIERGTHSGGSSAGDGHRIAQRPGRPANANGRVAPATRPFMSARSRRILQDCGRRPWFAPFLRRAFFLRRRFEDIGPPLSGSRSPSTGLRVR
ncbi:hypothetical protein GCM10010104_02710 [Streptomyces indiaensis]|uniref:FAD-binding domain-containing protein n=1 Tax=Streptomyces indiaensis TaxID=284033 RepID=A0ABP6HCD9_9ACTN